MRNHGIYGFISARWELIAHLSLQLLVDVRILLLLLSDLLLDVLRELLRLCIEGS